jgi:DNA-binding transcriptional LysR family regulator
MGLRHLRNFMVAAEENNFHRTADRLDFNQSTISRQMRRIEDELGADLFLREPGHGVRLTEVGRAFLRVVQEMFKHFDLARTTARTVASGKRGRLRLAASEDVMTGTLARIITGHREQWPEVHLDLMEMPAIAQIQAVQRGAIDLGLMLPPVAGTAIISDPLWSEECRVALPKAHPLVHQTRLRASDFAGHDVIVGHIARGPRCCRHVLDLLDLLDVRVRIAAEVDRYQTALTLVQSGAGIAFVPDALARAKIDGIVFRPFTPAKGRMIVYGVWPDGATSGLVAQFLRVARAVMAAG